jgi:hypothetical protein
MYIDIKFIFSVRNHKILRLEINSIIQTYQLGSSVENFPFLNSNPKPLALAGIIEPL